ncbi:phage antirepressor KilAC domain-containing protein [Pseudomonas sp. KSR10]|uniref:phage antirepressor KilAC domain-containing protein n=1 Tax=Pseudomonas sp. KSR10 TaxID=2916654 RepID=UPI001EF80BAE|nr:phage antirepressor KilAC domain-containing protein [Pseudomonas sp. KSR10]MCG6541725.1 phage antirepressor KilAC domain-containing protein [Pseudomonas sp. KSR10]
MDLTLQKAAARLGITRPKLIEAMRNAALLDANNLPAKPVRDRLYLKIKDGQWFHPKLGMQYSRSARVTPAGINWLAEQLGIERPAPPPVADPREVA